MVHEGSVPNQTAPNKVVLYEPTESPPKRQKLVSEDHRQGNIVHGNSYVIHIFGEAGGNSFLNGGLLGTETKGSIADSHTGK